MKSFTYRSLDEKENLEAILRRRKRKLNRQQVISGVILTTIIGLVLLYCGRQILYTEYDGYIHLDVNRVRAPYNIYLDSVYVSPGKIIAKGDTLFSYYVMDWLVHDADPDDEPEIHARRRNLILQYTSAYQQTGVLDVRIAELKKQIAIERHNIQFGLSDNAHKLDLERELLEAEARKKALRNELGVLARMIRETNTGNPGARNRGQLQIYENPGSDQSKESRRYYISNNDAFIVNVHAPMHMVFFEQEDIITLQHLDLQANNLQVLAYVPIDKAHRMSNNMKAEVIVGDDLSFSARVVIKGIRAELVPEHLRSYFARQNTALIALLEIDKGQVIPFWSTASGLPVTVRVRNFHFGDGQEVRKEDMRYEVGRGFLVNDSTPIRREPAATTDTVSAAVTGKVLSSTPGTGRFRIIVNVFGREEWADIQVKELHGNGWKKGAKMYRSGKWWVYSSAHDTREEAAEILRELKRTSGNYREAWILDTQKQGN